MQPKHFSNAFVLTLAIVISFIVCWEYYWRSKGIPISYNDDKTLWAKQRKKAYKPMDQATVFLGGSRIKFDLDIAAWKKLTGEEAIQLAIVGTPAHLILRNLANDEKFKGKLVIDVAESQFFSIDTVRRDKSAREALEYYYKETPAQKVGVFINSKLESNLVFLEEGKFGLNSLLNDLEIPNRPGVVVPLVSPKEFMITNYSRQNSMTPVFLADLRMQKRKKDAWAKGIALTSNAPVIKGDALEAVLEGVKTSIDKIRSRGGLVVFVRPPSDGLFIVTENRRYPRQQYWDHLLAYTNTPGIYFSDYPEIAHFVCPESSHLAPLDAVTYTNSIVRILKEEKGWAFPKLPINSNLKITSSSVIIK